MHGDPISLGFLESLARAWQRKRAETPQPVFSALEEQRRIEGSSEAEFFKYIPCPICGEDQYTLFHDRIPMGIRGWKHRAARVLASLVGVSLASALASALLRRRISLHSRDYRLMQCLRCKFFFRNPTYTEKGLDWAYGRGYASFLTGDYSGERKDMYGYIYDRIDLAGRTAQFTRKRLLDFGCGFGLFLDFMRSKGWDPHGFDFAPDCIELGRKNFGLENIRAGTLDENTFEGDFDAVSLVSVAAHLTEPMDVFRRVHRILRPGGLLLIWTVNADSYGHRRFREKWNGFTLNHVIFFDARSITNALTKAGFEKVEFGHDDREFNWLEQNGLIQSDQKTALRAAFERENLGNMLLVLATKGEHGPGAR